jgi:hypothetical protein
MRPARFLLFTAACILLLAGKVSAQALVEHAIAAAGGSAAGVAGKKVSDGIDSIMGKVDKMLQEDPKKKKARPAGEPEAGRSSTFDFIGKTGQAVQPDVAIAAPPVPPRAGSLPALRPLAPPRPVAPTMPDAAPTPVAVSAPPPPPPPVTAQDVQTMQVGASRNDLLTRLGSPSSRIVMPEDGGLVEVYTYRVNGAKVGSVRLLNGAVTEVQSAN